MTFQPPELHSVKPIGYLPKRTMKFVSENMGRAEEACSVSCCLSNAPRDALSLGRHNPMGLYWSETLALSVIPPAERPTAYDFYSYFMAPIAFDDDGEPRDLDDEENRTMLEAAKHVEPMNSDYLQLGWDIVGSSLGWSDGQVFECSPLTCNGLAREINTNRHGLIDGLDRAFAVVPRIIRGPSEPGTYYLVQVWRKSATTLR
jgi:hypothetical protein